MNAVVVSWLSWLLTAGADPIASEVAVTATPPTGIAVEVTGDCPTREAVMAALVPVLGVEPPRPLREPPRVTDAGDHFEVTALGQSQQYVDTARNCVERARVAAVFIVLALNPPTFATPPPPRVEVSPPPPPAPPSRDSERWLGFAVAARLDNAVSADGTSNGIPFGGELRVAFGWHRFGIAVAGGLLAATQRSLSSVSVRQQRFPFSVSASLRHDPSRAVRISAALGVTLIPFSLRGEDLGTSSPAVRLDAGARAALELRFPNLAGRIAPFVGVHAEYFPRPYQVEVDPLGRIGSTGRVWLGVSAGVGFESRR